jgi:hypothetical protein
LQCALGTPNLRQVTRQCANSYAVLRVEFDGTLSPRFFMLTFHLLELLKAVFPLAFERPSHHPIFWVDRLVPSLGSLRFVSRLFDAQLPMSIERFCLCAHLMLNG